MQPVVEAYVAGHHGRDCGRCLMSFFHKNAQGKGGFVVFLLCNLELSVKCPIFVP